MDHDPLGLHNFFFFCGPKQDIFRDLLDKALAPDGQRHATAALSCLKILFRHYHHQVPLSHVKWFSQHYRHPAVDMKYLSHQRHTCLPAGRGWKKIFRPLAYIPMHKLLVVDSPPGYDQASPDLNLAQHLRNCASNRMPQGMLANYSGIGEMIHPRFDSHFRQKIRYQRFRSKHLQFLLQKSAYSHLLLKFARQKVFRFGYLQRDHPIYIKKAIFALAKYIHHVTGSTAEVRACESIWGRASWFTNK